MIETSLTIHAIDLARREPEGFRIQRARGSGDYLFIHSLSRTRLLTREGERIAVPGDCLLYSPEHPQLIEGEGERFCNDFFHADGPALVRAIRDFAFPTDTILRPAQSDLVTPSIAAMMVEHARREPYWEHAVVLRLRELLLALARASIHDDLSRATPDRARLQAAFRELRQRILGTLEEPWSVSRMAREVHLSRTRFTVIYGEFFGISPRRDLVERRIARARWLLARLDRTVAEVATLCGFTNPYHFSRMFRRRVGCSPSTYQRHGRRG